MRIFKTLAPNSRRLSKHLVIFVVAFLVCASSSFAAVSSSTNYQFSGDITTFGGHSTSTSYQLDLTSQVVLGYATSTNYQISGGAVLITGDSDGIPDAEEDAAHNGGDGNGDGVADSQQDFVASFNNGVLPSTTLTIEATSTAATSCTVITAAASVSEASLGTDASYSYPVGLIDYSVSCTGPGASTTVTAYFDTTYATSSWVFRKHKSGTGFGDMNSVANIVTGLHTYTTGPASGTSVTYIRYQIQDGDANDEDSSTNSSISDPFGPAVFVVTSSGGGGGGGGGGGSAAPDIRTVAASSVSDDAALLNGRVDDRDDWEVFFVMDEGVEPSCKTSDRLAVAGSYNEDQTFSLVANNLQAETTYYFRACGIKSNGNIETGTAKSFTTDVADGVDDTIETTPVITEPTVQALATTDSCQTYITSYIKLGGQNDPVQVRRLQKYLNTYEGAQLPIDGVYTFDDYRAVLDYQNKYADEILQPWGISEATGYVFTTTSRHINSQVCVVAEAFEQGLVVDESLLVPTEPAADDQALIESLTSQLQGLLLRVVNLLQLQIATVDASPVVGAFETLPDSCPFYLAKRVRPGVANDPAEVTLLQQYLNVYQGENLALDGTYDADDIDAVKRYQQAYADLILDPWGLAAPTGDVYVSTTKHINSVVCGGAGVGVEEDQYPDLFSTSFWSRWFGRRS